MGEDHARTPRVLGAVFYMSAALIFPPRFVKRGNAWKCAYIDTQDASYRAPRVSETIAEQMHSRCDAIFSPDSPVDPQDISIMYQ